MNLLTFEHVSKGFADRILLQDVSFSINDGDRIGVIGINGAGKSTLLKMIAGLEPLDGGKLIKARGLSIEYLPQQPEFPAGATVLQAVLHGLSPVMQLIREYETAAAGLEDQPGNPELQNRLIRLSAQMDDAKAWNLDGEAKSVLTRLGITDFRQLAADLSGGQKKRVALAAALVNPADLLILDEPTNHIDPVAIDWLEQYLSGCRSALLMVTHDRYFLERVTRIMLEIDQTRLFSYEANYENWLELKAGRIEREQSSELKRQNLLRHELAWIRRGAKARSTKQQARIERFNDLNTISGPLENQTVSIAAATSRLGSKTVILGQVSKSLDGKLLFRDFSYTVNRHERLGIIGPNGCGKTTLLQIIAGIQQPDTGIREIGSTVRLGFFTQENESVDPDLRVIEYIRQTAELVKTPDGELSASQMLERFLFTPAMQWTPVQKLSGGEKRRLFLLKILMGAPNILLLDEPANDLDLMTLSILEDYLDSFSGAVIAVSHDRYFLDRIAERILAFENSGLIHQYEGNYQDYQAQVLRAADQQAADQQPPQTEKGKVPAKVVTNTEPARIRLKMSEKLEYETIEARIADLEQQRVQIQHSLEESASDYVRLLELAAQLEKISAEQELAMDRWLYLNERVEQIGRQNN